MSRSYHITRKQADKAMDAGDLDPTWQASEKKWVKKKEEETRALSKALPRRAKTPNRAVVSKEKERTARAKPGSKIQGILDGFLSKSEEPNKIITAQRASHVAD
jgi:hypothetical protein